ncbi:unnamed protein product [Rhizophagus irregularis]|nr:unnamed protein product [Rhizophagus irregularis]
MASMVKNLMMFGKGSSSILTLETDILNVEERMVNDDELELFVQIWQKSKARSRTEHDTRSKQQFCKNSI